MAIRHISYIFPRTEGNHIALSQCKFRLSAVVAAVYIGRLACRWQKPVPQMTRIAELETEMRYRADITAGALKVPESRVVADLLLRGVDQAGWRKSLYEENILQTRSPMTAKRLRTLIQGRLETMDADLWRLVRDGTGDVATHACLAAAVKHSPLVGDFLDLVVRDQYKIYAPALTTKLWNDYLEDCRGRDPDMPEWSESTRKRLRSSVFQILAEAGYIENTRTLKLQTVHIAGPVLSYLEKRNEQYVLRCIQVGP